MYSNSARRASVEKTTIVPAALALNTLPTRARANTGRPAAVLVGRHDLLMRLLGYAYPFSGGNHVLPRSRSD